MFQQPAAESQYEASPPRPYAWKTDEFQTENEPRKTVPIDRVQAANSQRTSTVPLYQPSSLTYQPASPMSQPFRCPHCMSQYLPRVERRISTAGWITFSVLLVFFFPLFWIGLLIKEDVKICQSCNTKLA